MGISIKAFQITIVACALSGCASPKAAHDPVPVPAGKAYFGHYLNVMAPKSESWHLLESTGSKIAFARAGNAPGESFIAEVTLFRLGPTESAKDFEAFIVKKASADANTKRFTTTEFSHRYSTARGYPCVRIHNVSIDRQAQVGGGKVESLILENENFYCRHPVHSDMGFVITYSHRGKTRYPKFEAEAISFEEGVQIASVPASHGNQPNQPPQPTTGSSATHRG